VHISCLWWLTNGGINQSGYLKCDYLAFHLIPYLCFKMQMANTHVRKCMHTLPTKSEFCLLQCSTTVMVQTASLNTSNKMTSNVKFIPCQTAVPLITY
jgi:hypothetical protein